MSKMNYKILEILELIQDYCKFLYIKFLYIKFV